MPRTSIYFPDKLWEDIKKHKKQLNLSKTCQKAVKAELDKLAAYNYMISEIKKGE